MVLGFKYAIFPKSQFPSFLLFLQGITYGKFDQVGGFNTSPNTVFGWILCHGSLILYLSLKVLQWYYVNESTEKQNYKKSIKIQPPIMKENKFAKNQCGICKGNFKNPACLETSGYVFCYTCIYNYLLRNEKCPITEIKSNIKCIRKIRYDF